MLFVLMLTVLFLSGGTKKTSFTEGSHPGDYAPEIKITGSSRTIRFANPSGRYTLVNFWATYDAASRVRNIQLYEKVNRMDSACIRMYSISMDENYSVYTGTLDIDNLRGASQLHEVKGVRSLLYRQYNLKKGFRNFLVDDHGVIVATGVHSEDLDALQKL
jgi:hypothetical protein